MLLSQGVVYAKGCLIIMGVIREGFGAGDGDMFLDFVIL